MSRTWPALLNQLVSRVDLSEDDTLWAMNEIMSGNATGAQIGAFVVALRSKGETAAEVAGMAAAMLSHARRFTVPGLAVDVVGTGGDQSSTVNISTMSAIVVAAAGVPVVKHGNRSASSQCGTADVLERLGVAIELSPAAVQTCVEELGIGFCFAPAFHPAMRHAGPIRKELGIPTAFNILGPLTTPAQPAAGLIGCAKQRLAPVMAEVLAGRGFSVLVVRGDDGWDEITPTTTTSAWVVSGGSVREDKIDPARLGLSFHEPGDLKGAGPDTNAAAVRAFVSGVPGAVRETVLLNASGAIAAYRGFTDDLHADLRAAMGDAAKAVDSGAAGELLERWIVRSSELAS
jgi:anthranilate phosphoribosyltransferase